MAFRTKTIYLQGEGELSNLEIEFSKIVLPTGTIWGGMKFAEGQKICLEPPHPVHGVLLMKEDDESTIKLKLTYQGKEYHIKLNISAGKTLSTAEISPGQIEIAPHMQSEYCVWFNFRKKSRVVSMPIPEKIQQHTA